MASTDQVQVLDRYQGCLLGGAVGDALGAPVEFMSLAEIRARFGPRGIRDYSPAYGRLGAITDDTQMTLFTAEGLLRAHNRGYAKGLCHPPTVVYYAYLRWLDTQGERAPFPDPKMRDGWLVNLPGLRSRRAPGNTCLSALRHGKLGTMEQPVNDSKGCGGVMRVAPVGLAGGVLGGQDSFGLASELAALTHGHPSGFLAAGFFAAVIDEIIAGAPINIAIVATLDTLRTYPKHEECLRAVEMAQQLANDAPATPETVEKLGQGWVAEEALAIALFCSLVAKRFEDGVLLAVNHGGDSDSTGAMTGNILGAHLGKSAIPSKWREHLELRHEIEEVATDLFLHFGDRRSRPYEGDWEKYPGG
ncbi:MAG: ADP-ribosylglycohydrolase family protein [Chloroflexota bacterium]|nr:ADP-ribosylglycohydrolase family protein [Chloroflexota bacterium]